VGSPMALYSQPANRFVAGFIGSPAMNFIPCRIVEENSRFYVEASGFKIPLSDAMAAAVQAGTTREFVFGVRPEDISRKGFEETTSGTWAQFRARVNVIETLGKEIHLDLTSGENLMTAIVSPSTPVELNEEIDFVLNMDKVHLFKKDNGVAIC
ncbi:MAG: TOBE domain-containing protein, partial [Desulfobacterales bacterium]